MTLNKMKIFGPVPYMVTRKELLLSRPTKRPLLNRAGKKEIDNFLVSNETKNQLWIPGGRSINCQRIAGEGCKEIQEANPSMHALNFYTEMQYVAGPQRPMMCILVLKNVVNEGTKTQIEIKQVFIEHHFIKMKQYDYTSAGRHMDRKKGGTQLKAYVADSTKIDWADTDRKGQKLEEQYVKSTVY